MKKKIVVISILCVLISIVFVTKINDKPNSKTDTIIKEELKVEEKDTKDEQTEIKQDDVITDDSVNITIDESQPDEKKEQPKETEKTQKVETPSKPQEVPKNNIPSNNTEQTTNNNSVPSSQPNISNPKEKTPWDSLGITEYDYYNKPAHSLAEIDFSVKTYGDRAATLKACQDHGNNYISEHGGGYFCDSVNSYSGNYLGEDIDFY